MRIAVLTGGGDSPGCNMVLYAITVRAEAGGHEVLSAELGWKGVIEGKFRKITQRELRDLIDEGGTIIGTSRTNPFKTEEGPGKCLDNLQRNGVDALITIGGDDTNGAGYRLFQLGAKVVGIPQTIDGDLSETEYCIGFDSALANATDAIDKLRTTARSHRRIIVVEVMGRDTGWLTLFSGIAGGADIVLIPEVEVDVEQLADRVKRVYEGGQNYAIIAVSEGVIPKDISAQVIQEARVDEFGHVRLGGISIWLAPQIEEKTGIETRAVVLGHLQRGGKPTAIERVFATILGVKAVEMCEAGEFGKMAVIKNMMPAIVPMELATKNIRTVSDEFLRLTEEFR